MMSIRSLADFNGSSLGGAGDWQTPPPSPSRAHAPGQHDERGMGTFTWPPARTSSWPPARTFSWPRTKQYLKDGRALRIETVINSPGDLLCKRRLQHLHELQAKARAVNARLLDTERVGQGCVLASPAFERVAQSTLTEDGRRSPALRFGDPRVMALLGALCVGLNALGFTNRSLRAQVSHLLGVPTDTYTRNQASYDLARLRLNRLIQRRPGTNT